MRRFAVILAFATVLASCGQQGPNSRLVVGAAANLTGVMDELGAGFTKESGIAVVPSYGSTAQLAQQIENGAPFDVFFAADTEHVDQLVAKGEIADGTRAVYARGQLVLWVPNKETGVSRLWDLAQANIRFIAVAQPEFAPYGRATVEALQKAGLWETVQPKIVYANSINAARQYAATGNAEVAFTAYSLVLHEGGTAIHVDPALYNPIEQALGIVSRSQQQEAARRFAEFVLGPQGQAILERNGYLAP